MPEDKRSVIDDLKSDTGQLLDEINKYKNMPEVDLNKILGTVSKVLAAAATAIAPQIKWLAVVFNLVSKAAEAYIAPEKKDV